MSYSEVFGGAVLYPAGQSYLTISFSSDITLAWPVEQQVGGDVVSDILDLDATATSLNVNLPDARQVSKGVQSVFVNIGSNTFTVQDAAGGVIISVSPGAAWVAYLTDNTTLGGTWRTFQLGATVSVSDASALAGLGLKAISTTLNQTMSSRTTGTTPLSILESDRAGVIVYTGGVGVANLPAPGTVGSDWFFMIRNSGSGDLVITPPSGTIDGSSTLTLGTNESSIIFTDGTNFFTIGFGQSNASIFDFISIAIPGSGDFTLSGVQLDRVSYRFTGVITGNRKIVVPSSIQQYWVDNSTTGGFEFSVATVSQVTPVIILEENRAILYCDGTTVLNANSTTVVFPIVVSQGGTGATTAAAARLNLGVVPTTRDFVAGIGLTGGGDLSSDRTFDVEQSTEADLGGALIASQTETNDATDDEKFITALKHATSLLGTLPLFFPTETKSAEYTLIQADVGKIISMTGTSGTDDDIIFPALDAGSYGIVIDASSGGGMDVRGSGSTTVQLIGDGGNLVIFASSVTTIGLSTGRHFCFYYYIDATSVIMVTTSPSFTST